MAAFAFLLLHELDAIRQGEWRFFFSWAGLADDAAYRLFTVLHLPLLIWMLWALPAPGFQLGLDSFLLLHALAHFALRRHPLLTFNGWFSWLWIYGGAALGLIHLLLR